MKTRKFWRKYSTPGSDVAMGRGFLVMSPTAGLPFVLDEPNDKTTLKKQRGWMFYSDWPDKETLGHVGTPPSTRVKQMYDDFLDSHPKFHRLTPFPFDPTGRHPWMIGDVFLNRAGRVFRVIGFVYNKHSERVNVRYRGLNSRGKAIHESEDDSWYSQKDLEYFRLRKRRVVDWETYLVLMIEWGREETDLEMIDEAMHVIHYYSTSEFDVPQDVRSVHEQTCHTLSHRPTIGKGVFKDHWYSGSPPETEKFWRICARERAKKELEAVRRTYEDVNGLEAPYQIKATLNSAYTGTPTHHSANFVDVGKPYESRNDIERRLGMEEDSVAENPEDELFAHLNSM